MYGTYYTIYVKSNCKPPFWGSLFGRLIFARSHDFGWPCAALRGAVGELGSGSGKLSECDTCKGIFRRSVLVIRGYSVEGRGGDFVVGFTEIFLVAMVRFWLGEQVCSGNIF